MTGLTTPPNEHMQALADEHRDWLAQFDARYTVMWERLLDSDDEAAMGEASVRRRLEQYGVTVKPNEDLDTGQRAPDFRCESHGFEFCVEVTCIRIETAEKDTGIPHGTPSRGGFRPPNLSIFNKCINKARQAATANVPVLVAVGTWHCFAAMLFQQKPLVNMLLTGDTKMTWEINIETGEASDTFLTTNLYPAIFLKLGDEESPAPARESISGALLCSFGMAGVEPVVVLNPNACRPFNPAALPQLEYGSVAVDREKQQLSVSWSRGDISNE